MRAFRILRMCLGAWLLVLAGCSDVVGPPTSALDLDGRYTGYWDVIVFDTTHTCGGWGGGCDRNVLAKADCPTVFDMNVTGDSTFAGTFTIDTAACEYRPSLDSIPRVRFADGGQFVARAFAINRFAAPAESGELVDLVTVQFEMMIGTGTSEALETLLGCRPFDDWENDWVVFGTGGDADAYWTPDLSVTSILYGHAGPRSEIVPHAWCDGRHVILEIDFKIERSG